MSLLPFGEALRQLLAAATPVAEIEMLPTGDAAGRVLAHTQTSALAVPPFDNSAMDGYAVRCADVPAVGTRLPVAQRIVAGSVGHTLEPGTAARIFTGAPLPPGADAVVMQELCEHGEREDGTKYVVINHAPRRGESVRRTGEDIRCGEEILPAGARLTPQQLGLAASVGIGKLPVLRRLRVALLSTGDELVTPGSVAPADLPPGAIYNSNRYLLRGLLQQLGCEVGDPGTIPDRLDATRQALHEAAQKYDLIISSGGVSVGEEDHLRPAVMAEGELAQWKIAIKPGKPLAFGRVRGGDRLASFIGLPGNPVASFVTFVMLVRPFILKAQGVTAAPPPVLNLRADFDWPRADARREFLRARRNPFGGVDLFAHQGSAVLTSAAWADGLVDNPPGQAIRRGDTVSFLPFADLLY